MKILIVANGSENLLTHRRPLIQTLLERNHQIAILLPETIQTEALQSLGSVEWFFMPLQRKSLSPFSALKSTKALMNCCKKFQPDVIISVTLKVSLFTNLAVYFDKKVKVINIFTGLGHLYINNQLTIKALRKLSEYLLKLTTKNRKITVVFQNQDDIQYFLEKNILSKKQTCLIKGSGVDVEYYQSLPEPSGKPKIIFPSRLLRDKGIYEFIEAAKILQKENIFADFVLVGELDHDNPTTITQNELQNWLKNDLIEWWGFHKDMRKAFAKATLVCLPSHREGLPKVLLEAGACSKTIITTDVPGCREIIKHNQNGFLVPAKNAHKLADAIRTLLNEPEKRAYFSEMIRKRIVGEFSNTVILQQYLSLVHE